MRKSLPLLAGLCLATLLFTSAYARSEPASAAVVAVKPTKHPGQGNGHGNGAGQVPGRGGPCGQPAKPKGTVAAGEAGKVHYDGTLTAIGAASITISTTLSGTVRVDVVGTTCIHMPPRKGVGLGDLWAGLRVGVQALPGTGGGNPTAVRILVHKPRPVTYVGAVTAYTPGVRLTLQPDSGGSPLTFALNAGTEVKPWHRADDLAVGSHVTLQAVRDFAGPNPPVLKLIVHGPDGDGD